MILLNPVVQMLVGPMVRSFDEFDPNRARVIVVPTRRHLGRPGAGDPLGELEEPRGGRHIACLTQPDVD
jgi:hypothetical protein